MIASQADWVAMVYTVPLLVAALWLAWSVVRPEPVAVFMTIRVTADYLETSRQCPLGESPVLAAIRDQISPHCGIEPRNDGFVVYRRYLEGEVPLPPEADQFHLQRHWRIRTAEPFEFTLCVPAIWIDV